MGMYKRFGNTGEHIPVNIFLHLILLNAVRMSSAQRAPTLFNFFHFLSGDAMRILIRRRGIGALSLFTYSQLRQFMNYYVRC